MKKHASRTLIQPLLCSLALAVLTGCATSAGLSASADLQPTKGNSTSGSVSFIQSGNQVLVSGEVRGLKPNAEHGFHVHEKGDCSSGDGMSTGGHFNPAGKPHGPQNTTERHAGDLPSLKADAQGRVDVKFTLGGLSVGSGAADDVVGKGLIVHAMPDDYRTQPTGNAGARIACAVIARHQP